MAYLNAPAPPPAPDPAPPTPVPRRGPDVALLAFLGVVVLAVVGSSVALGVRGSGADKPVEVARAYLQALASADAAKAISFTSAAPVDQTLLTNAVLADSQQRAPLTDVAVTADPSSDEAVEVSYRLGDEPVTDRYTLSRVSGSWKLDQVSVRVDFVPTVDTRIPVLVNGTPVELGATEAFPVSYAVTTGLPGVDWGDQSTTTVSLDRGAAALGLDPRLTDTGRSEFVSGARQALGACVSQHKLDPPDCPFGYRQPTKGPRIPDSTVRWSVRGNPWSSLPEPAIDSSNPGTARTQTSITVTNRCRYTTGQECTPTDQTRVVVFVGDVTADPIKVELAPY